MRVTPCTQNGYNSYSAYCSSRPKARMVRPIKTEVSAGEQNYGKGLKQLSYVIGMSILGISSIILGTRGKTYPTVKL